MIRRYYEGQSLEDMVVQLRATYLTQTGWLRSADRKEPIDAEGRPIPWMTYPALEVLARIAKPHMKVFEFGAGGSTHWWREKVASVVSVEHDGDWAQETGALSRPPGRAASLTGAEPYLEAIAARGDTREANGGRPDSDYSAYLAVLLEQARGAFDIIVIDGVARNTAAAIAADYVRPEGFVVFDNSDRHEYAFGYDVLKEHGFARLDYWGAGPINPYGWCTSIFTRTLDIFR
ncbi:MAG: hypothetical protein JNJ73_11675 [Hyphomonadaceae bacterium]|nr:hypothetical protein [Hyphomonadaceae bacterium]